MKKDNNFLGSFAQIWTKILAEVWTEMSADTERSKFAKTDTDTEILAEMSAETYTETDNFLSLVLSA